jgi:peptidoglycan/xylan/chitin deacetylase (PgdA/CDA1 family)
LLRKLASASAVFPIAPMKRFLSCLLPAALAAGLSVPTHASAEEDAKKPTVVILKLDDLRTTSPKWRRVLEFLKSRNIKSTAGIICNSLEGDKASYFSWVKDLQASGMVEMWCHGYTHGRSTNAEGKDVMEFKGVPYEEQKATLVKCQQLAKEKLGAPFRTFGAPFNATDEATLKALSEDPDFKVFLFGNPAHAAQVPGLMIQDRSAMNIENPLFIPNTARVEHDLKILRPKREYFVIQGHPEQWDEARIAEFGKMIDYLCSQGVIFTTPYEYYLYKQDPAAHPLPAPAVPGAPIVAQSAPLSELAPATPAAPKPAAQNQSKPAAPAEPQGDNILSNGGFEEGTKGWSVFAPQDAQGAGAKIDTTAEGPHEGGLAGTMSCAEAVRFAIVNFSKQANFTPGDRYRLSAWVKAGPDFEALPGTPGFMLRASMFSDSTGSQGTGEGLFYLGTTGAVKGPDVSSFKDQAVPKEWTKLEGVFEVPPDTVRMNACAFIWKGKGTLLVDDVRIEPVDKATPLSASN